MSDLTKAEATAHRLLSALPRKNPPVDVEALAQAHGVMVEFVNLGEDTSGVLVREGQHAVIGVNWDHHPNRQRFTIAHELGHFLLHDGGTYLDKGVTARFRNQLSGSGTDDEERQANAFAAALLMPKAWIMKAYREHPFDPSDEEALREFSDRFGVSTLAMSIRLTNLELLAT